jgi:hypothetical protein
LSHRPHSDASDVLALGLPPPPPPLPLQQPKYMPGCGAAEKRLGPLQAADGSESSLAWARMMARSAEASPTVGGALLDADWNWEAAAAGLSEVTVEVGGMMLSGVGEACHLPRLAVAMGLRLRQCVHGVCVGPMGWTATGESSGGTAGAEQKTAQPTPCTVTFTAGRVLTTSFGVLLTKDVGQGLSV